MKDNYKKILIVVSLSIIVAFIIYFTFFFLSKIYADYEFSVLTYTAFLGAFFAFLITRLVQFFDKISERKTLAYNASVMFERIAIDYYNWLSNTEFVLESFLQRIEDAEENVIPVSFNQLPPVEIDKKFSIDLANIDFVNSLKDVELSLSQINDDVQSLNVIFNDFRKGLMQGQINYGVYKSNLTSLVERIKDELKFIKDLEKRIINLQAQNLILLEDMPIIVSVRRFLGNHYFNDKQKEKTIEKEKKLLADGEKRTKENRDRISKIINS